VNPPKKKSKAAARKIVAEIARQIFS